MKPHVADWQTRVYCARIVATDGTVVRLASYPRPLNMTNGSVYASDSGYEFSGIDTTADMSPPSVDLGGILDHGITRAQLDSGLFDNARCFIFATSFLAPLEDEEPLGLLLLGKVEFGDSTYKAEIMGLEDALNQNVGDKVTPQCQSVLFDRSLGGQVIAYSRSQCTGPRGSPDGPNIADYLVTGAITAVTSQYQFQDSSRAEADDWFGEGEIRFVTGQNSGQRAKRIKTQTAGGWVVTHEPFFYPVQPGDQYEMIPGCRKRLMEDCVGKFDNAINMKAMPHTPTASQVGQVGRGGG